MGEGRKASGRHFIGPLESATVIGKRAGHGNVSQQMPTKQGEQGDHPVELRLELDKKGPTFDLLSTKGGLGINFWCLI